MSRTFSQAPRYQSLNVACLPLCRLPVLLPPTKNGHSVRIVCVPIGQNLSNSSLPNCPIDIVATNDGLYSVHVGAHQADYYNTYRTSLVPRPSKGLGTKWRFQTVVGGSMGGGGGVCRRACSVYGHTLAAKDLRKFSPRNLIFHPFANVFSLESFPLYGTP